MISWRVINNCSSPCTTKDPRRAWIGMEHCILQEKKKNQHFVTDKCSSFQVTSLLLTTYFNYFAFMINFLLKIFLTPNRSLFRWMAMPYLCLGELAEHLSFPNIIQSSFLRFLYLQLICEDQFVYSAQVKT